MPESAKKSGGSLDGCFKKLMISAILSAFVGLLLLGVIGGVVYMNREKVEVSSIKEWGERFKVAMKDESDDAADGTDRQDGAASAEGGAVVSDQAQAVRRPVAARAPMYVDRASFAKVSQRSDVLVLVDYYADWCGPCKRLGPSLAKLAQQHGDKVIVLKVNVDTERQLAAQAGVSSIPDVRILHGGKQVDKFVGLVPYGEIEKLILHHESLLPPARNVPTLQRASGAGSIDPVTKRRLPPGMSRK